MGGRGASSGMSADKRKYGTEYRTLLKVGNVKFIEPIMQKNTQKKIAVKPPMETMSKNRIYVTIGKNNAPKTVTFYDENNKRFKTIDIIGRPHKINGKYELPHAHYGYLHDENGSTVLSAKDTRRVERLVRYWYNHINKSM